MAFRRKFNANTNPIRFLKFRRRKRWPWSTGFFNQETVAVNGDTTTFALIDYTDYDSLWDVASAGLVKVHRLQCRGGVTWLPEGTTLARQFVAFNWGVTAIDDDDNEDEVFPDTNSSFYPDHTVLAHGLVTGLNDEIPGAQLAQNFRPAQVPINFDLRFRRPIVLRPRGYIRLSTGFSTDVSGTINSASLYLIVRACVQAPGVGR